MKKGIFALILMLGFSLTSYGTCGECGPCTGHYYVCDSSAAGFDADLGNNCGPGTSITIEYLAFC